MEVLFERRNGLGIIALNRPRALNALSLDMLRAIHARLDDWARDGSLQAVLLRAAQPGLFCAGGDVRAVCRSGNLPPAVDVDVYFRAEYRLNQAIHDFPKPWIAFLDGVTMGGGAGISVHGAFRIATENTLFAMPETRIGLVPDVGAGFFLNRCPGAAGLYLALTAARIRAADMLDLGLATHFMPAAALPALEQGLSAADWSAFPPLETVERILVPLLENPGDAPLQAEYGMIEQCFNTPAADGVPAILEALSAFSGEGAAQAAAAVRAGSPTALLLTLKHLRAARGLSLRDCLAVEYRLSQFCAARPDFQEGVRAALLDKDRNPRWRPATLAAAAEEDLDAAFSWNAGTDPGLWPAAAS